MALHLERGENFEIVRPDTCNGTGVLVLAGSSGAVERERANLVAGQGALAMSMRWFGGAGQPALPAHVPLESFGTALDRFAPEVDRLVILGSSFGAEAALSYAARDDQIDAVIAISPSAHVWPSHNESGTLISHWTWGGHALDFVPLAETWNVAEDPPAYRSWYEQSLLGNAGIASGAAIPVEAITGDVVLIAGEDDQVWPSAEWAKLIQQRRCEFDRSTTVVTHPEAGHRVVFPGERPVSRGQAMRRGGNEQADALLGLMAWPHVLRTLRVDN